MNLRKATDADVPALVALLSEDSVRAWWGDNAEADVREALPFSWCIELDGDLAGLLHVHEETNPEYPQVELDIAVATRLQGRGLGQRALREAISMCIERGHHRFVIAPAAHNERAIRSYEAIGFKPIGIARESDRAPDGSGWWDSLLMDLLAREFVRGSAGTR